MKKYLLSIPVLVVLAAASCKKDDAPATTTTPGGTTTAAAFTWTENGGAARTADSAYWTGNNGRYTGIRAFQGGTANFFEINWDSSAAVGTHTLGTGLTLVKGAKDYVTSTSGTVNITANASDKLTGTITSSVTGSGLQTVTCTFTALPKR